MVHKQGFFLPQAVFLIDYYFFKLDHITFCPQQNAQIDLCLRCLTSDLLWSCNDTNAEVAQHCYTTAKHLMVGFFCLTLKPGTAVCIPSSTTVQCWFLSIMTVIFHNHIARRKHTSCTILQKPRLCSVIHFLGSVATFLKLSPCGNYGTVMVGMKLRLGNCSTQ